MRRKGKHSAVAGMLAAVLAFMSLAGCGGQVPGGNAPDGPETDQAADVSALDGHKLAEAVYPEREPYPDEMDFVDENTGEFDDEGFSAAYDRWWTQRRAVWDVPDADGKCLESFSRRASRQFLSGADGKNRTVSPVNLYLALAMLAEITEGESRGQILELLDAETAEEVRTHAANLWNLCYSNDGAVTTILANSLWLQDGMDYRQETLDRLAKDYFASSYSGVMGSEEYNQALQAWLNQQTGGLLKEQAAGIRLSPETVLALASTLYYRAKWQNEFSESATAQAVFHGSGGEEPWDFLNSSSYGGYYWGEKFGATALSLNEGGSMWLILPDEGVTVEELLADEETFDLVQSRGTWENHKYLKINLSLPKFDVVSDLDLIEGLKAMGVEDVFDSGRSDFSPLMDEDGLFLSEAKHASRVKIDEKGVEAAAYTVMAVAGAAMPPEEEMDLVFDRPFLFALTSKTGLPLFVGVVNTMGEGNPEETMSENGAEDEKGAPYAASEAVTVENPEESAPSGERGERETWAYIRNLEGDRLWMDPVEYIQEDDRERIGELGLTEADLTGGFCIYNPDPSEEELLLTPETEYTFIDWGRDFVDSDDPEELRITGASREQFETYLNTYENSRPGMPFFFRIRDGAVVSVTEEPMA